MEKSFSEIMGFKSMFGKDSTFNPMNELIAELERKVVDDTTIDQTLVKKKRNSANGFYYLYDGTLLGNYGTSNEVVVCDEVKTIPKSKINQKDYDEFYKPVRLKMTNAELNTRAFMSTFRMAENYSAGKPTDYNFLYGRKKDGGGTFTDSSYEETPADYKDHPRKYVVSWGNPKAQSPAGAYQINVLTWDDLKDNAGVTDFSPKSQDAFAKYLMYQRAAVEIKSGDVDNAMKKLNGRWSSLPGGKDQQIDIKLGKEIFKSYIARELNGLTIIATPVGSLI